MPGWIAEYMRSCILKPVREGFKPVEWKGDSRHAVYVLHAFRKKTRKTSKGDIEKAKVRLQAVLQKEVNAR